MKSNRREPCPLGLADEQARKRLRVEWPAVLGRDDLARVRVVGTPGQPLRGLMSAVNTQRVQHLRSQREGTTALGCLGLGNGRFAVHHDQGVADGDAAAVHVHINPAQAQQFAPTHPQRCQQKPRRLQPIFTD